MYIITVANQKGGVAKTTTAINLAAALSLMEQQRNPSKPKRVLLVDMDPQCHAATAAAGGVFGEFKSVEYRETLADALVRDDPPPVVSLIREGRIPRSGDKRNLDFLPTTSSSMTAASQLMVNLDAREYRLVEALEPVAPLYKYTIIDTRPSLDVLTINALVAATHLLIPVELTALGMDSLSDMLVTVDRVRKRLNNNLKIAGILPSRCNLQRSEAQEILEQLQNAYGDLVLSPIKERAEVTYAHSAGLDIFSFRPPRTRQPGAIASASQASQEFARMADEVLRMIG